MDNPSGTQDMKITAQQEKFCQSLASGMTQADAYRASYNCAKSKTCTVVENASRLMADSNVSARVAELRAELSEKALWTRENSVQALKRIADGYGTESKPGEVVAAVKELNSMHGYNEPVKVKIDGKIIKRIELVALR